MRWRESDTAELQRAINNFNAKLYYINKNKVDNSDLINVLPDRVKKGDIISGIQTRADFNRAIKSLQSFSKRGAENLVVSSRGARATQWEIDEFKKKERRANMQKKKELEKLPKTKTSRGQKTDSPMGTPKENSLKPTKTNFNSKSQKEWEYRKDNIDRALNAYRHESEKHNMRLNYILGLKNAGFSVDIEAIIYKIPIDAFIHTVNSDLEASFDFIYDPIEHKMKNDILLELWQNVLDKYS